MLPPAGICAVELELPWWLGATGVAASVRYLFLHTLIYAEHGSNRKYLIEINMQ
jgi:hypothetical protein